MGGGGEEIRRADGLDGRTIIVAPRSSLTIVLGDNMKRQGLEDLHLLVGFSEGSASNIVARMISPALGKALNQIVRIERIPGENGALCMERWSKFINANRAAFD